MRDFHSQFGTCWRITICQLWSKLLSLHSKPNIPKSKYFLNRINSRHFFIYDWKPFLFSFFFLYFFDWIVCNNVINCLKSGIGPGESIGLTQLYCIATNATVLRDAYFSFFFSVFNSNLILNIENINWNFNIFIWSDLIKNPILQNWTVRFDISSL